MRKQKEERRKFTAKEAEETLVDPFERPIWIDVALGIPEARQQLVEKLIHFPFKTWRNIMNRCYDKALGNGEHDC